MQTDFIEQLMEKTNDGADIIMDYYPQSRDYFGAKTKFKIREESDASASWYQNPRNGHWCVTDFGDDGKAHDAIDVAMKEENLDWHSTVALLLERYGVSTSQTASNRIVRFEDRRPGDEVGQFRFVSESFTDRDLSLWGKPIKEQHLSELNWHKASETFEVREDKVIRKVAVDLYPIFVRKCNYEKDGHTDCFHKIYEPRAKDKQYRFRYAGNKPPHYINGLYEAELLCKQEEAMGAEKRQPVVICCGERDAAVVKAYGCKPIWFNSESDFPRDGGVMEKLRKLGPMIYFIPDIDDTGIAKGKEFALRFPYLQTIWLPMSLKEKKDWRGNPQKDLRDWANLPDSGYEAFHNMLADAPSAEYIERNERGRYFINTAHLHHYLWLNGFGTYEMNEGNKQVVKFGRRVGCKLDEITDAKVVINYLLDNLPRGKARKDMYNLINSKRRELTLDSFTAVSRLPYEIPSPIAGKEVVAFENCVVEVTPGGFNLIPARQYKGMIHASNVVNKPFRMPKTMPMEFDYSDPQDPLVKLNNTDSCLLRMLINTSRVHWDLELQQLINNGMTPDDYYTQYPWCMDTQLLTIEQEREQWECLINKIYAIGYLCSRYKKRSESFAPYFLDLNSTSETSNGRSGKGIIFQILSVFVNQETFDGRSKNLTDYQHSFDRVTKNTDILLLNDYNPHCAKFDVLYNMISDGMVVNPKGKPQFELSYEDTPKIAFTSNFILPSSDASTEARALYVPVGDYYHKATADNNYLEDHSPKEDFKIEIGQDYGQQDWDNDFAVILCCIQFYLVLSSDGRRYNAPQNLLTSIRDISTYSSAFDEWATGYFTADKIGIFIERESMTQSYREETGDNNFTAQQFKKWLVAWLNFHKYDLNKCEVTVNGRIMQHSQKYNRTVEHFFISKRS